MQRYQQLAGIIDQEKPKTIIEVGTWNGVRAQEMALVLMNQELPVHYVGFDLFEEATEQTDEDELNVKEHFSKLAVSQALDEFKGVHPDFTYELHKGNTRQTLKELDLDALERPILAFIDGGHSCKTIASDLNAMMKADAVIMDDWYEPDEDGKCPDITKYGCNSVLEAAAERDKNYFLMPVSDAVKGGGRVHMVSVKKEYDILVNKKLEVKTKNAVSDDAIQRNILYALSKDLPDVARYYPHDQICSLVSGGESFKEHIDQIRADQGAGNYLVCVKTAHDQLLERGIVPDACILLDPRAHVVEFIKNPHPDVQYYVASQVYWETLKHLLKHKANVTLYHAMVGAGEQEMLGEGRYMILGGSTSATRGISLLHTLGFRNFKLYGYDSSFEEQPPKEYLEKFADKQSKRPMKIKMLDEEFWTTAELIAQSRDFEQICSPGGPNDARIELIGSEKYLTLMDHLYRTVYRPFETWQWKPDRENVKAA